MITSPVFFMAVKASPTLKEEEETCHILNEVGGDLSHVMNLEKEQEQKHTSVQDQNQVQDNPKGASNWKYFVTAKMQLCIFISLLFSVVFASGLFCTVFSSLTLSQNSNCTETDSCSYKNQPFPPTVAPSIQPSPVGPSLYNVCKAPLFPGYLGFHENDWCYRNHDYHYSIISHNSYDVSVPIHGFSPSLASYIY